MAFKQLPGNQGMIYVPDGKKGKKKNPCPDCFSCQWCGNERCRTCRAHTCCKSKKRKYTPADTGETSPVPQDNHDKATESGVSSL